MSQAAFHVSADETIAKAPPPKRMPANPTLAVNYESDGKTYRNRLYRILTVIRPAVKHGMPIEIAWCSFDAQAVLKFHNYLITLPNCPDLLTVGEADSSHRLRFRVRESGYVRGNLYWTTGETKPRERVNKGIRAAQVKYQPVATDWLIEPRMVERFENYARNGDITKCWIFADYPARADNYRPMLDMRSPLDHAGRYKQIRVVAILHSLMQAILHGSPKPYRVDRVYAAARLAAPTCGRFNCCNPHHHSTITDRDIAPRMVAVNPNPVIAPAAKPFPIVEVIETPKLEPVKHDQLTIPLTAVTMFKRSETQCGFQVGEFNVESPSDSLCCGAEVEEPYARNVKGQYCAEHNAMMRRPVESRADKERKATPAHMKMRYRTERSHDATPRNGLMRS